MIKDIVVNLGLGAHDPAGDYAVSVAEIFEAHVLGMPSHTIRSFPAP